MCSGTGFGCTHQKTEIVSYVHRLQSQPQVLSQPGLRLPVTRDPRPCLSPGPGQLHGSPGPALASPRRAGRCAECSAPPRCRALRGHATGGAWECQGAPYRACSSRREGAWLSAAAAGPCGPRQGCVDVTGLGSVVSAQSRDGSVWWPSPQLGLANTL